MLAGDCLYTAAVEGRIRFSSCLAMAFVLAATGAVAADLHFVQSDRSPVKWQDWLEANGRTAVLVWSSWAPQSRGILAQVDAIKDAAKKSGLGFVIVDVQEEFEAGEEAIGQRGVSWLHDRHGSILKEYRLIRVPILLVVDREGNVIEKLDSTPESLESWGE